MCQEFIFRLILLCYLFYHFLKDLIKVPKIQSVFSFSSCGQQREPKLSLDLSVQWTLYVPFPKDEIKNMIWILETFKAYTTVTSLIWNAVLRYKTIIYLCMNVRAWPDLQIYMFVIKGTRILGWATHPYPDDSSNFNALVAELYSFSLK